MANDLRIIHACLNSFTSMLMFGTFASIQFNAIQQFSYGYLNLFEYSIVSASFHVSLCLFVWSIYVFISELQMCRKQLPIAVYMCAHASFCFICPNIYFAHDKWTKMHIKGISSRRPILQNPIILHWWLGFCSICALGWLQVELFVRKPNSSISHCRRLSYSPSLGTLPGNVHCATFRHFRSSHTNVWSQKIQKLTPKRNVRAHECIETNFCVAFVCLIQNCKWKHSLRSIEHLKMERAKVKKAHTMQNSKSKCWQVVRALVHAKEKNIKPVLLYDIHRQRRAHARISTQKNAHLSVCTSRTLWASNWVYYCPCLYPQFHMRITTNIDMQ